MSFQALLCCHSECGRGIHLWMLRFAQHDKTDYVIPSAFFCHSERSEESTYGCFASLSMTEQHGCFTSLTLRSA